MITPAAGLEGFCAGLHAEHPSLGLTLIRTADSMSGLIAAQRFAATEPGQFRQVVLDASGGPQRPVMGVAGLPAAPAPDGLPGPAPGRADVVLITGGQPGNLLAAAGVLAGSGARLALIGPPDPDEPAAMDLALAGLRDGGAEVSYLQADLTDPDEADAAVASVEQRVGPVTVVCYAAGTGPASACSGLSAPDLRARMSRQADGLRSVLGSVNAARLRLLLTAGSAAARYGTAGQCGPALLAGALAEQARRLEPSLPGCRILHADWDPDLAAPDEVGRLLLGSVASQQAPARVAIHGRLGPGVGQAPRVPGPGWWAGGASWSTPECTTRAWNWSPRPASRWARIPTWPTTCSTASRPCPRRSDWRRWHRRPPPSRGGRSGGWPGRSWRCRSCSRPAGRTPRCGCAPCGRRHGGDRAAVLRQRLPSRSLPRRVPAGGRARASQPRSAG